MAFGERRQVYLVSTKCLLAWLVKHYSYFPIQVVVRTDGKTAWEREFGRKDRRQVCVFFTPSAHLYGSGLFRWCSA